MPMKYKAQLIFIAMMLCASGAALAGIPEPDVIYFGAAPSGGETVRLYLETDRSVPLAECDAGDMAAHGDKYALRTPMDALAPLEGKTALIYVGDGLAETVVLPAPGAVVELDLGEPAGSGDPADIDEDGLPDIWETAHFNRLDYGPADDPDNDGFDNMAEYENGTRPGFPDVEVCLSDAAGHLDIADMDGSAGGLAAASVIIADAPNAVSAFGFDVTFDKTALAFETAAPGDLAADFAVFEAALLADEATVRVSGADPSMEIPQGADGQLARLHFRVLSEENSALGLINLAEDLANDWLFTGACLTAGCTGDVNGDGDITPADALAIFEKIEGVCPTTAVLICDDLCSDVNNDGQTTPADALCVFNKALEILDCLD